MKPVILLVDNGSLRANATLQLRKLSQQLGIIANKKIHPVSLSHADKISIHHLGGKVAQTFEAFMAKSLQQGCQQFIILPLFFGKSAAITTVMTNHLASLQMTYSKMRYQIADVVYPLPEGEPILVDIVYQHIMTTAQHYNFFPENLVLVDHGSPLPQVSAVRKHITECLQKKMSTNTVLQQAVMERRKGNEYLFNGELLTDWLINKAKAGEKNVMVSLLFFLAGRHTGEGGDIDKICQQVMQRYPDFNIVICPLIAEHPQLVTILLLRLQTALQGD